VLRATLALVPCWGRAATLAQRTPAPRCAPVAGFKVHEVRQAAPRCTRRRRQWAPLLLIHGAPLDAPVPGSGLAPELAKKYTVIAPDAAPATVIAASRKTRQAHQLFPMGTMAAGQGGADAHFGFERFAVVATTVAGAWRTASHSTSDAVTRMCVRHSAHVQPYTHVTRLSSMPIFTGSCSSAPPPLPGGLILAHRRTTRTAARAER